MALEKPHCLEDVGDFGLFHPVIRRLVSEPFITTAPGPVRLVPAGSEERPFSYIMRLRIARGPGDQTNRHLFVKILKPKADADGVERARRRVVHEFEATKATYHALSRCADLGAVLPVACYPEHCAIVTEEAPGQTLLTYLQRHARWLPARVTSAQLTRVLEATGRWIRTYQTVTPMNGDVLAGDIRTYIDIRLERLVRDTRGRLAQKLRARILDHVDALLACVSTKHLGQVMVHADLSLGNVLVDGTRIVVLDFAMARPGNALLDVSRLFVQIGLLRAKPQFLPRICRELQLAVLRGYDPALDVKAPMFRLMLLQHHINHLATMSLQHEAFPKNLYNWHLRRLHRSWITRELRQPPCRTSAV